MEGDRSKTFKVHKKSEKNKHFKGHCTENKCGYNKYDLSCTKLRGSLL